MKNRTVKVNNNDLELIISLAKEVAEPSEKAVCFCKWIIKALLTMLTVSIALNVYLAVNGVDVNLIADNNSESNIEQHNG